MKRTLTVAALFLTLTATAENRTIDISGNNTSSDYVSYDKAFSIPVSDTVNVKMARYCNFSSTITGKGTLYLHAGGERCYLGTAKGAAWPNWTNFTGDVHVFPFKQNAPSAGFFGIVMAHGGKSFSPENIDDAVRSGKVNKSMENNRLILHDGSTLCCEANTAGAGFRIGELQAEAGSSIIGYMKQNTRAAYFLVGCKGTDATLAGTIAPPNYSDTHPVGIIKEGKGTYRITGNNNYLSGALRILEGRVLVMNNSAEAKTKKLRGSLGAKAKDSEAIAYVFSKGVLGGTGNIGGSVDNYGTIEPSDITIGTLTLQNFVANKRANLFVHPASVLRFKVGTDGTNNNDQLVVDGDVKFFNTTEDFTTSDQMPFVELILTDVDRYPAFDVKPGDEFLLLSAKTKTGDWHFELKQPDYYTWELIEREEDGKYTVSVRLVSFETPTNPDDPDNPDHPDDPDTTMGPFYDDGINDNTDKTTLRTYAEQNDKRIGVALSTWKTNITNTSLAETKECGSQFNLLAAENEMKMDALQPSRGSFTFGSADNLVTFAQRNKMAVRGHCLVWHQQQPEWVSSDGKKNDKNWSRAEALKIMESHITTVMRHFKGKVTEWDVVNECLDDDQSVVRSNPDAYTLRQTVWQRAIGNDYIDSAFVYARRADPDALLYLNDYDVELQGKAKAVAFHNLVMHLKKRDIPIDGVGLQCHFSIGDVDSVKLENTVRRFGESGMKCIITELEMGIPSTSAKDLEEQARLYRVITDIVLNNDNCPNLVIWGLKDNDSWRSASNPLLYTSGLSKKQAWYAVRSALRHRALTKENAIHTVSSNSPAANDAIYTLQGIKVGTARQWDMLPGGLYIKAGKIIRKN